MLRMEVKELRRIPLTGAQTQRIDRSFLSRAGLTGSRAFVLYDADKPEGENNRVSQKQARDLARISVFGNSNSAQQVFRAPGIGDLKVSYAPAQTPDCIVTEFGNPTPAVDQGDEAADFFAGFLSMSSIRLAKKTTAWTTGFGIDPAVRKNAPFHIVTDVTIDELRRMGARNASADNLRPDIVLHDESSSPFKEHQWVGGILQFPEFRMQITRATQRCPVPGNDPLTGERNGEIPALYRDMSPIPGQTGPHIGVYGFPLLPAGEMATLGVHDLALRIR